MVKKCFYYGSDRVVKNGRNKGRQLYLCKSCGRQFLRIYSKRNGLRITQSEIKRH